ncbi:MAG: UvrD-helicase domain-containing protein [Candidatus Methylacidiphilales bacterium]|nr:UvrD-helicase domain-containing protein [Candidatus Methylacidiphilales bacterium]
MKPPPPPQTVAIPHVMITASAGSGKTWHLTNRILTLILAGAPPETIIALTFTRKAAGEFFDAVLGRLAGAADDPQKASQLCRDLGIAPMPPESFLPPLRALVERLHRLQFTTIDSFFHRIVSSFPFELGLSGAFTLMDGHAAEQARVRVLERILSRSGGGQDAAARRNFLEHFKQATFGTEAKSPAADLDDHVRKLHALYQEIPDTERWAGSALPAELRALAASDHPLSVTDIEAIRQGLAQSGAKDSGLAAWDQWAGELAAWKPTTVVSASAFHTIRKNIVGSYDPVTRTCGEFNLNRNKIKPTPALARALGEWVACWTAREIRLRIEQTQGVGKILAGYDWAYDRLVRRSGLLVFADLPLVIGPVLEGDTARLDLDYRLDARFDHWLLDEFQDTSRAQWRVLENLVDEVVQDPTGGRSFFCVGDVKQSIYAWRGGDHRLFQELRQRYGGKIEEETLATTYRCSGAVVDLVNRVMGGPAIGELLPGAGAWGEVWQEHRSMRPATGFAAYLEAPEKADDDELEPRHWMIGHLIKQIDPPGRGLTCAVLVWSNQEARTLADHLRVHTSYPVILEGEIFPATDNLLGRMAVAWALALAHPSDTLAEGWLRACPIGREFSAQAGDWRARTWKSIHDRGFEDTLASLFTLLEEKTALDDFHRVRRRLILDAVREFEQGGSRDAAALAAALEARSLKSPDVPGAIEVMTIHKAKGLGFDVVFVTELVRRNKAFNRARGGPLICRDSGREVEWLLFPPTQLFSKSLPELQTRIEEGMRENAYEQLCLLYVALTRAREALYLIGDDKPGGGESVHAQHLLAAALATGDKTVALDDWVGARAVFGETSWFEQHVAKPSPTSQPPCPAFDWPEEAPVEDAEVRLPSMEATRPSSARDVLSDGRRQSQRTGNRVHALFSMLESADDPVGGDSRDADAVRACLAVDEIRRLFRTGPGILVWREKAFQIAGPKGWQRGIFDRVVVECGTDGRPVRAELVDFKTDVLRAGEETSWVERHRPQMEAYRSALSLLLHLEPAQIRGVLVAVSLRRVVHVF